MGANIAYASMGPAAIQAGSQTMRGVNAPAYTNAAAANGEAPATAPRHSAQASGPRSAPRATPRIGKANASSAAAPPMPAVVKPRLLASRSALKEMAPNQSHQVAAAMV